MKKIKIIAPITILVGLIGYIFYPSKQGAEQFNQELTGIKNAINSGTINDFRPSLDTLNGLLRRTSARLSEIEFKTDEKYRIEGENLKVVIERIQQEINSIEQEKRSYDNLLTGNSTPYEIIKSYSTYMANYPHGVKRHSIEGEYTEIVSGFIDGFSNKIDVQLASLKGDPAELDPIGNMFQLVAYANDQTTRDNIEIDSDNFEQVYQEFAETKEYVNSLVSAANLNFTTANGNTPLSLKQQFDDYEKGLLEARKQQETAIKSLVYHSVSSNGWEDQARHELFAHIVRRRVGWLRCEIYNLTNTITQAEDYKTTLLSDRVEVVLKYNVSSYCSSDAKYRYYQGTFTLVYPVIRGKLGEGYFKSKYITETT